MELFKSSGENSCILYRKKEKNIATFFNIKQPLTESILFIVLLMWFNFICLIYLGYFSIFFFSCSNSNV